MKNHCNKGQRCTSGTFCRMGPDLIARICDGTDQRRIIVGGSIAVLLGTMVYGFVFGVWRDPLQGLYSAVKMPILFFATVLTSATANTMLGQAFGAKLQFRQVCTCMLVGMAVASSLLGAISPVLLFFIGQLPAPGTDYVGLELTDHAAHAITSVYWRLLLLHVSVIGAAGFAGNLKLYRLLVAIDLRRRMALTLLAVWIGVSGFVGCELSWLLSPFLCAPTEVPHFVQRGYFEENFYERMWRAVKACANWEDHTTTESPRGERKRRVI